MPLMTNEDRIYQAQKRREQIEERVLATFLREMAGAPLSESEWQFIAVRCAQRLLESAEASLHTQVLKAAFSSQPLASS